MTKKLNLFNYIGGKFVLTWKIINMLDYTKNCYIELFGGSAKVLLNKKPHKTQIYNDINDDIVNLWLVVKNNCDEFMNELKGIPFCEGVYKYYRDLVPKNNVERAVKTFILNQFTYLNRGKTFAVSYARNKATTHRKTIEILHNISDVFKDVVITNKSYDNILKNIREKTDIMLFADPPYYGKEKFYEKYNFTEKDHLTLAEYLNNAKYSVLITYSYFDKIEELYPPSKWNYVTIENCMFSSPTRKKMKEVILTNYELVNELI